MTELICSIILAAAAVAALIWNVIISKIQINRAVNKDWFFSYSNLIGDLMELHCKVCALSKVKLTDENEERVKIQIRSKLQLMHIMTNKENSKDRSEDLIKLIDNYFKEIDSCDQKVLLAIIIKELDKIIRVSTNIAEEAKRNLYK